MGLLVCVLVQVVDIELVVCIIGQYCVMFDQVMLLFEIIVDYDFDVMVFNQIFNGLCFRLFEWFDVFYMQVCLDCVLVYGDIIIVMIVVLVVFYYCILIGYVEVGLCIGDINWLWLEEMNWWVIDVVGYQLYVFIFGLCVNLVCEYLGGQILVIGNIVIDVLQQIVQCLDVDLVLCVQVDEFFYMFDFGCCLLLVIGYCCESFGQGFEDICCVLVELV